MLAINALQNDSAKKRISELEKRAAHYEYQIFQLRKEIRAFRKSIFGGTMKQFLSDEEIKLLIKEYQKNNSISARNKIIDQFYFLIRKNVK
ncbi:hypothetical protein OFR75_15000 [Brachyspira hyodysenteriae]|nr:hypothetical protein [Brachyspira hyodysenteriae]